jgi:hypothetical protein
MTNNDFADFLGKSVVIMLDLKGGGKIELTLKEEHEKNLRRLRVRLMFYQQVEEEQGKKREEICSMTSSSFISLKEF